MASSKQVLIMAGGTGGHVFPALALAAGLEKQGYNISWLGTKKGLEARLVPTHYDFYPIDVRGMRRKGLLSMLGMPWQLLRSFLQTMRLLKKINPNMVIGMGGYVSGPGAIAAWVLRKPLLIHEQNAIPGLTNRVLSKIAAYTFESFPNSFKASKKLIYTGNLVRESIVNLPEPAIRFKVKNEQQFHVLVIGGSLGARFINQLLPQTITASMQEQGLSIWHQTGEAHIEEVKQAYQRLGIEAKIVPFIGEMEEAYTWADIVIGRAGATTVAELAMAGVGSILIPFPYAVDDHQTWNAKMLEKNKAALLIQEKALTPTRLQTILQALQQDRPRVLAMAVAAREFATPNALENILEYCLGVSREKSN